MINVPQKCIQRGDTLTHAALDMVPFRWSKDSRHEIERQNSIDRVAVGIDGESNAEIEQFRLGDLGAAPQVRRSKPAKPRQHFGDPRIAGGAVKHLAIKPSGLIGPEQARWRGRGGCHGRASRGRA